MDIDVDWLFTRAQYALKHTAKNKCRKKIRLKRFDNNPKFYIQDKPYDCWFGYSYNKRY